MTRLNIEIEKLCSFTEQPSHAHIDALVLRCLTPFPGTDGSYRRLRLERGVGGIYDLLCMREPPHKLIYAISLKLRQLMAARLLYENGLAKRI